LLGKWKRSATLVVYWKAGLIVCENYRVRSRAALNARAFELLAFFDTWKTYDEVLLEFIDFAPLPLDSALENFVASGILIREGTEQAKQDTACELAWLAWMPKAGLLHFGSNDTPYDSTEADERATFETYWSKAPQPEFSKSYPHAPIVNLPPPAGRTVNFRDVLFGRRSHRSFSPQPLLLQDLATLLHDTWAVTGMIDTEFFGALPLKTSPSGGARHPEEVYVCALNVEGLSPGIYHYVSNRHVLERIRDGVTPGRAIEYCAGQEWVGSAAALFIMTAVFARTMWKYPFPRAYRIVLAEVGHLCQTFCLVATSLGLGPFETMAIKDSLIEADLGIDGYSESVLYVAGVGVPTKLH